MPSSQEIQAEIEQIEVGLEPVNAELDRLYIEFGKALPASVEAWMTNHVRRRIEEHAATVNAGGVEPLRQIKAELNVLFQRLPEICTAALGEPAKWPHRHSPSTPGAPEPRSRETHSAASFRRAISHLGFLLAKHGLIADKPGYVSEWEKVAGDQYRYAINPGFDERRFPVLMEYREKRSEQLKQLEMLELKRQELTKARAGELWNEA